MSWLLFSDGIKATIRWSYWSGWRVTARSAFRLQLTAATGDLCFSAMSEYRDVRHPVHLGPFIRRYAGVSHADCGRAEGSSAETGARSK